MGNRAPSIWLTPGNRRQIEKLCIDTTVPRIARNCQIILLAAERLSNRAIAVRLKVSRPTVIATRATFARDGMSSLVAGHRRNRAPQVLTPELIATVQRASRATPPGGGKEWSIRSLADFLRIARSTVQRAVRCSELQLHTTNLSLSRHGGFEERVRDVAGLYVSPPFRAMILAVNRRRSSAKPDRPTRPNITRRKAGDMVQVTALYDAFSMLHRQSIIRDVACGVETHFVAFLSRISMEISSGLDLHVILDSGDPADFPALQKWIGLHRSRHLLFRQTHGVGAWNDYIKHFFNSTTADSFTLHAPGGKALLHALYGRLGCLTEEVFPFHWHGVGNSNQD